MTAIVSRAQIRSYDQHAIEQCAMPGLVLMENAGRGAAEIIGGLLDELGSAAPVVVVCGPGNNGGDGFVVARHLMARGAEVDLFLAGQAGKVRGDARANLDAFVGLGGVILPLSDDPEEIHRLRDALARASVVVDALFGTGLDRPIEGYRGEVIECINEAGGLTVALDIPSGIDADRGVVLGTAVIADHTVTFAHHKAGMFTGPGVDHAGCVHCVGLGLPDAEILEAVGQAAEILEPDEVQAWLGRRPPDSHKYRSGSLLVVAGRPGKVGAALLAARGALRTGAGIVTIGTWPRAADALDAVVSEVMTARIDPARLDESLGEALRKRNAVAIGPGLGLDETARELVERVVLQFEGPAAVDADAISLFASRPEALRDAAGPRVLTPHTAELARLMGSSSAEVEADRWGAAEQASLATGQVIVLKGRHTVIAVPDGRRFICTRGNALLATAGSGDVLTGMLGALLCIAPPAEAASAAVFLHATVADLWAAHRGVDRGMIAGDIVAGIPEAMASLDE